MDRIDALKARLDALRPLSEAQIRALWPRLDAEKANYVQATTAIEGNTLTLGETIVVLQHGVTIGGKTVKEHVDILNSARAYDLMLDMAKAKVPITARQVFDLHAAIVAGEPHAGAFRDHPVYIFGSMHVPPNPASVPERVDDMLARYAYNKEHAHPVVSGSILHFDLLTIHPFADGNGRTARLLNNLHLISHGYPPVLIDPIQDKPAYFDVLKRAQLLGEPGHGDPSEFVAYMGTMETRALEHYLGALAIEAPNTQETSAISIPKRHGIEPKL